MHGVLDKAMHHKTQLILGEIGSNLGQLMTDPFLSTAKRSCPMRRFLGKKTSIGYFAEKHL